MRNLAESILALFAGHERAAAIYGDLTEMAATRSRLWFAAAYLRTLISLGWRGPVAFLVALASVMIMWRVYPMWVQHAVRHLPTQWQVNMLSGKLAVASGPFLNTIAFCLWFALPFAWFRFGYRDRVTQFACVMLLSTFPVYGFRVWLIDISSFLTMLAIVAALLAPLWRRPFAVLALTCITGIVALVGCFRLLAMSQHQHFQTFSPTKGIGGFTAAFALAIAAFVCSLLHRWLLQTTRSLTNA